VSDSFDLERFVDAQASIYRQVVEELSRGRKQTHWMWFIFPQIAGLGFSAMAQRFAIGSHAKAVAYLEHDLLGPRLVECTRLVMAASEKPVTDIEVEGIRTDRDEHVRLSDRGFTYQQMREGTQTNLRYEVRAQGPGNKVKVAHPA
jgi:uncharacterized protein (DUF1810 family)